MNKTPAEVAKQLVEHCGDKDLAQRTAERLTSEHFAMNPTDSRFWHEVAEVLRNEMVSQWSKSATSFGPRTGVIAAPAGAARLW